MNYTTLIAGKDTDGSIKSWISYGLIPSTTILAEAETEIFRRLRTREMRATATIALAEGAITAALPTGYLDPIALKHRDTGQGVVLKPTEDLLELRVWSDSDSNYCEGRPSYFAVHDDVLNFDVRADQAYTLNMAYWKRPTALSADNQTHFLCTRYPALLRVACMRSAAEFMEAMDKFDRYEARLEKMLREIAVMDDLSLTGLDPSTEYRDYD
jgi:hypothetical protein